MKESRIRIGFHESTPFLIYMSWSNFIQPSLSYYTQETVIFAQNEIQNETPDY